MNYAASKGGDGHYCKEAAILTCATIKKTPGVEDAIAEVRKTWQFFRDRRPDTYGALVAD